jgi:branched-chain amino acid transport system ATP-binding protein
MVLSNTIILKVNDLSAGYGRVEILRNINLEVHQGELACVLGANGAGKSTLLRVFSGVLDSFQGKIFFDGKEITHKKPESIVSLGLIQIPEGRQIFSSLSVKQNLLLGTYARRPGKQELFELFTFVFKLFPVLEKKLTNLAGDLSGGEQQMLAIARGLMSRPKMLLLDEPSLGLAPLVVKNILEVIQNLSSQGIPILLVEQNALSALSIAKMAYILETGKIVNKGMAADMLGNDEVRKRYLGK